MSAVMEDTLGTLSVLQMLKVDPIRKLMVMPDWRTKVALKPVPVA